MQTIRSGKFKLSICILSFLLLFFTAIPAHSFAYEELQASAETAKAGKTTYIIDVNENFTKTMASYVKRSLQHAEVDGADYFLINLNTYANYDRFAKEISDLLLATDLHTVCYVDGKALDGAALLTLSCDTIIMSPGADFGSGYMYETEALSDNENLYWQQVYRDVLAEKGRKVNRTPATLSPDDYPGDQIPDMSRLSISASTALKMGLADYEATSLPVVLEDYGLANGVIIQEDKNFWERGVDIMASPVVSTILLLVGLIALLVELVISGDGFTGIVGAVCLFFYLFGSYEASAAQIYMLFLPLVALVLILTEIFFSPGGSVCGTVGLLGLLVTIALFASGFKAACIQAVIVLLVMGMLIMVNSKNEKSRNILKRLVLRDKTTTEEGYLSQPINIRDYVGKEGIALTALRPAGAVKIGSDRVDVVTEGDFIAAGDKVKVIKVDGSSIIVRKTL